MPIVRFLTDSYSCGHEIMKGSLSWQLDSGLEHLVEMSAIKISSYHWSQIIKKENLSSFHRPIVTYTEHDSLHIKFLHGCVCMCLVAAAVFFFAYWIYMTLTTIISPTVNLARVCLCHHQSKQTWKYDEIEEEQIVLQPPRLLHLFRTKYSWGLALRQLLTVLCGIDLVIVAIMSKFGTLL